jgi:hypothetical protein
MGLRITVRFSLLASVSPAGFGPIGAPLSHLDMTASKWGIRLRKADWFESHKVWP